MIDIREAEGSLCIIVSDVFDSEVHQLFDSGLLDRYFGGARSTPASQSRTSARSRCLGSHCRATGAKPDPSCIYNLQMVTV